MAKKTSVDKLSQAVDDILAEYGDEVAANMGEAVKKVTKAGTKAVREESRRSFGGSGRYAKGWKSQIDAQGRTPTGVIYNKDLPGLPHLLEFGHLNRDGSRTPGRAHIEPAEKKIAEDFEKEVMSGI